MSVRHTALFFLVFVFCASIPAEQSLAETDNTFLEQDSSTRRQKLLARRETLIALLDKKRQRRATTRRSSAKRRRLAELKRRYLSSLNRSRLYLNLLGGIVAPAKVTGTPARNLSAGVKADYQARSFGFELDGLYALPSSESRLVTTDLGEGNFTTTQSFFTASGMGKFLTRFSSGKNRFVAQLGLGYGVLVANQKSEFEDTRFQNKSTFLTPFASLGLHWTRRRFTLFADYSLGLGTSAKHFQVSDGQTSTPETNRVSLRRIRGGFRYQLHKRLGLGGEYQNWNGSYTISQTSTEQQRFEVEVPASLSQFAAVVYWRF